jgi:hypothetical protein
VSRFESSSEPWQEEPFDETTEAIDNLISQSQDEHIGGGHRLPAKQRKHLYLSEWLRPWHAAGIAPCLLASSY